MARKNDSRRDRKKRKTRFQASQAAHERLRKKADRGSLYDRMVLENYHYYVYRAQAEKNRLLSHDEKKEIFAIHKAGYYNN